MLLDCGSADPRCNTMPPGATAISLTPLPRLRTTSSSRLPRAAPWTRQRELRHASAAEIINRDVRTMRLDERLEPAAPRATAASPVRSSQPIAPLADQGNESAGLRWRSSRRPPLRPIDPERWLDQRSADIGSGGVGASLIGSGPHGPHGLATHWITRERCVHGADLPRRRRRLRLHLAAAVLSARLPPPLRQPRRGPVQRLPLLLPLR